MKSPVQIMTPFVANNITGKSISENSRYSDYYFHSFLLFCGYSIYSRLIIEYVKFRIFFLCYESLISSEKRCGKIPKILNILHIPVIPDGLL